MSSGQSTDESGGAAAGEEVEGAFAGCAEAAVTPSREESRMADTLRKENWSGGCGLRFATEFALDFALDFVELLIGDLLSTYKKPERAAQVTCWTGSGR